MSGEIVSSAGRVGLENRTAFRSVNIVEKHLYFIDDLVGEITKTAEHARKNHNRRWMVKTKTSEQIVEKAQIAGFFSEVSIPLSYLDERNPDYFTIYAENNHPSPIPEWQKVYDYWRYPMTNNGKLPFEKVQKVIDAKFSMSKSVTPHDATNLQQIWSPFGWDLNGINKFISDHNQGDNKWFSAVRKEDGNLVSACLAEQITFAGIRGIETSEFGTATDYEGNGLCTAAVAGLISQIIMDTSGDNNLSRMIFAELNMSSDSHILARKLGFTIPGVELVNNLEDKPTQILRLNVPVIDCSVPEPENEMDYLRNFIFGVLPHSSIDRLYDDETVRAIINSYT